MTRGPARAASPCGVLEPHLADFAGVLAGVKPVLYANIAAEDAGSLARLCGSRGLRHLVWDSRRMSHHAGPGRLDVLVGRDAGALRAAAGSWEGRAGAYGSLEWGRLLGYPDCCVRAFLREPGEVVRRAWRRAATREPLPFLLNNVFNYFSRRDNGDPEDCRRYERIHALNSAFPLPALCAVSWHPCGYLCAESLRRARATFRVLARIAPVRARELRALLARPILYFDKYAYAVLGAGRAPQSLLEPRLLERVRGAKTLELRRGRLVLDGAEVRPGRGGAPLWLDFRGGGR